MITKKQFDKALIQFQKYQKLIADYLEQEDNEHKIKQKEREENCTGHKYKDTNTKWQSATQKQCINCGKIIE